VAEWIKGKVTSFNNEKGWGFISVEGQKKDVFVHFSAIIDDQQFKSLFVGDIVEVSDIKDQGHGPQTGKVRIIERAFAPLQTLLIGTIKRIGGRYGFVTDADGNDYYFSTRDAPPKLLQGDQVSFQVLRNKKGLAAQQIHHFHTFSKESPAQRQLRENQELRTLEELY